MNQDIQQLAKTLLASKLAASASEAQRMAANMLGVAQKVHDDSKKDHIYAVEGFKPAQKSVAATTSQPTPSSEAATFSSPHSNEILTEKPHPSATQQAITSPSPVSAPVEQGGVVSSPQKITLSNPSATYSSPKPAQEEISSPSPEPSWAADSPKPLSSPLAELASEPVAVSESVPAPLSVELETHTTTVATPTPSASVPGASQQANLLATEALSNPDVSRPEDSFASQFEGKTLSELSAESDSLASSHSTSAPTESVSIATEESKPVRLSLDNPSYSAPVSAPAPEPVAEAQQQNDFLNLRSKPQTEQQMSSTEASSTSSASSLDTGWPTATNNASSTTEEPVVQAQEAQPQLGEQPQEEKKERVGFTPEEQKLHDEVDLAKVFNFGNR